MGKKCILVLDDQDHVLDYIKKIILVKKNEFLDYEFDFCNSAEASFKMMESKKYHKIISDYKLTKDGMDGIDVLLHAKRHGIGERILLTAVSSKIELKESATYALRKPITPNDFVDIIKNKKKEIINTL